MPSASGERQPGAGHRRVVDAADRRPSHKPVFWYKAFSAERRVGDGAAGGENRRRLIKHAQYYWLLLAESHLTRRLLGHAAKDYGAPITSRIGERRPKQFSVLSETGEGKVFVEWVEKRQFLALRFCRGRRKGSAFKNLTGALHADGVGCTLSVGRGSQNGNSGLFKFRR